MDMVLKIAMRKAMATEVVVDNDGGNNGSVGSSGNIRFQTPPTPQAVDRV